MNEPIFREFISRTNAGSVEAHKNEDEYILTISDSGQTLTIKLPVIPEVKDKLSGVKNNIHRINIIMRGLTTLKNAYKKDAFEELVNKGVITELEKEKELNKGKYKKYDPPREEEYNSEEGG